MKKKMKQGELNLNDWRSLSSAPRVATVDVCLLLKDGTTCIGHWAQDLSGEEQPPFRGWFRARGNGYVQVIPKAWKPLFI